MTLKCRACFSALHSALIHDGQVYVEVLIERYQQLGLLNDVINMRNNLHQVDSPFLHHVNERNLKG